jgi:hypothetical protein
MDSSDLRLMIGLLFGTFLMIVLVSDLLKRRAARPKIAKEKGPTGFRRTAMPDAPASGGFRRTATPELPADGGFKARPDAPEGPRSPKHDFKVPRN